MICSLCDARCCRERLITITIFDALRIAKATGIAMGEFAELSQPRVINLDYGYVLECKEGSRILAIKSYPCYFLRGNRCSIYEHAPLICKLYPFSTDGRVGGMCPLHAKLLFKLRGVRREIIDAYVKEDRLYRELVARWNEEEGGKGDVKECWEFLVREGEEVMEREGLR